MEVHAFTFHERKTPDSRRDDSFVEPGLGDPAGLIPSRWFHGQSQLSQFLTGLDLLILTVPLTPATRGMIGAEQLRALGMRNGFLCNLARGPIVNTDDLLVALQSGIISGAALDVTDPEPLPECHPLWAANNVIITPHDSGNSKHHNERVLKILAENMRRRSHGKPLLNEVNKALGY